MPSHTVTAFFDSRDDANRAAQALRDAGVPTSDVSVSPETARDELGATGAYAGSTEPRKGFWASLEDMFGGYDDRHVYAEGVRRGGTLLTAHVDEAHIDRVAALLEQHGAVDLEEREESWRSEGWTGGATAAALATPATGAAAYGAGASAGVTPPRVGGVDQVRATSATSSAPAARAGLRAGTDEVLQVVEERLDVGKRAVSRGKVRLHSYVVEKEVSADVTLRDETVRVDRRVVDRPVEAAALGADAFKERTIEMEEIDEEAVVGKTARVVEEIGIRKDVTDRTETIRDTVRSTKVDVEDGRTVGSAATARTGDFGARLVKDMEVVGSDGGHVGTIDHVDGGTIKLKRMDMSSGGQHHLIPVSLVASVDRKVILSTTAEEAKRRWTSAG